MTHGIEVTDETICNNFSGDRFIIYFSWIREFAGQSRDQIPAIRDRGGKAGS
jgi:hypothetical protein